MTSFSSNNFNIKFVKRPLKIPYFCLSIKQISYEILDIFSDVAFYHRVFLFRIHPLNFAQMKYLPGLRLLDRQGTRQMLPKPLLRVVLQKTLILKILKTKLLVILPLWETVWKNLNLTILLQALKTKILKRVRK